jgi:hypothetical protein
MIFDGITGIHRVRKKVIPRQPNSAGQLLMRDFFRMIHWRWLFISIYTKNNWNDTAEEKKLIMSGYNFFSQEYIDSMRTGQTPHSMPSEINFISGRWSFNKPNNYIAIDDLNDHNDLTTDGTLTHVKGKSGYALNLDGATYVYKDYTAGLTATMKISIELWLKPLAVDSITRVFFTLGTNTAQKKGIYILVGTTNRISCFFGDGISFKQVNQNVGGYSTNWQHLVVTYDGTTIKMYVNGIKQTSTMTMTPPILYIDTTFVIGADWTGAQCFKGIIDEASIYNIDLSEETILEHYNLLK